MAVSVESIAVEHPGPELAERIASFDWVVFIDASASTETVRMTRVTGSETAWTLHSAGVCRLLGIAQFLYGRAPSAAILVEIPGYIYDR